MSETIKFKSSLNSNNLMSSFKSFQSSGVLVDVTLSCEGHSLKAHKLVLSACSPYFQSLFTENPCQHPIVFMSDMKFEVVKAIIDFIYDGEVSICRSNHHEFIKAAEAFKIEGFIISAEFIDRTNSKMTKSSSQDLSDTQKSSPRTSIRKKRKRAHQRSVGHLNKITAHELKQSSTSSTSIREKRRLVLKRIPGTDDMIDSEHFSSGRYFPTSPNNTIPRVFPSKTDDSDEGDIDSAELMQQRMAMNGSFNFQGKGNTSTKERRSTADTQSSNVQCLPGRPIGGFPGYASVDSDSGSASYSPYSPTADDCDRIKKIMAIRKKYVIDDCAELTQQRMAMNDSFNYQGKGNTSTKEGRSTADTESSNVLAISSSFNNGKGNISAKEGRSTAGAESSNVPAISGSFNNQGNGNISAKERRSTADTESSNVQCLPENPIDVIQIENSSSEG